MSLAVVKDTYERLGQEDPLFAVLSDKRRRHNRWDPEEFFQTGRREIREVLQYVQALDFPLDFGRALDFGCGVGRLSQALAEDFRQVVGVDISGSMIENARHYNRHGARVEYLVNSTDRLLTLDDDSFDFIYSNITLQHVPPGPAASYIREFIRVLRPGGLAIFQIPNGKAYREGSLGARFYTFRHRYVRWCWKRLRGRRPVEIHYIPRPTVERIVGESGGRMFDVVDVGLRRRGKSYRYCATK